MSDVATPRVRGQAFNIMFDKPPVSARGQRTPRVGDREPPRKPSFKFLRKDAGHRASEANQDGSRPDAGTTVDWQHQSQSLRASIVKDMHKDHKDPFSSASVAVPKRPPPAVRVPEARPAAANDPIVQSSLTSARNAAHTRPHAADPDPQVDDYRSESEADADMSREQSQGDYEGDYPSAEKRPVQASRYTNNERRRHDTRIMDSGRRSRSSSSSEGAPDEELHPTPSSYGTRRDLMQTVLPSSQVQTPRVRFSQPPAEKYREAAHSPNETREVARNFFGGKSVGAQAKRSARHDDGPSTDQDDSQSQSLSSTFRSKFAGPSRERQQGRSHAVQPPVEEALMEALEEERRNCEDAKLEYVHMKAQLEREREKLQAVRQIDEERQLRERSDWDEELDAARAAAKRDVKVADEKAKSARQQLQAERSIAQRLKEENTALKEQLDRLSSQQREIEKLHRGEVERLKVEIASLTSRNAELMDMTKSSQATVLQLQRRRDEDAQRSLKSSTARLRVASESEESRDGDSDTRALLAPAEHDHRRGLRERREKEAAERAERDAHERDERRRLAEEAENRRRLAEEADQQKRLEEERRQARKSSRSDTPVFSSSASSTIRESTAHQPRRVPTAAELIADTEPMPPLNVPGDNVVSQRLTGSENNKREISYRSGKREIHYSNGTRKIELAGGHIALFFTNGDIKQTWPSKKSTYWYEVAQTMHTQLPDGTEVFEFRSSNQTERHRPDGTKEILYPEGIFKIMYPGGGEETIFPDGTSH